VKVLTANRLADGAVVYLGEDGRWTHKLQAALRLGPEDAETALAQAQAKPGLFVGPYLIEANEGGAVGRERLRETIRAGGPTVGHSLKAAS
jgi:hypothetical protein